MEDVPKINYLKRAKNGNYLFRRRVPDDPSDFPRYAHTMTHEDGGALGHHDNFSTWVFQR